MKRLGSWAKNAAGAALGLTSTIFLFGVGTGGCLDRPVVPIIPTNTSVGTSLFRAQGVEDVDLLLMVDNSASMGDKQSELGRRIPELVKALTNPDPVGGVTPKSVKSLHVGVVTSSIGSQGTSACDPGQTNARNDDQGHILPRTAANQGTSPAQGWELASGSSNPTQAACPTPVTATAVGWAFDSAHADSNTQYTGTAQAINAQLATSCVVEAAGEDGCGYEQSWEAVYHFLVDPKPYSKITTTCTFNPAGDTCSGVINVDTANVDNEILTERKNFLRPQALLAVVLLTDENDFSLKPVGFNWLPWALGAGRMGRGWAACANVPDDFEPGVGTADFAKLNNDVSAGGYGCWSCLQQDKGTDPNCSKPWATVKLNNDPDGRNERGFQQVQRFGYNFLWERSRYVSAFSGGPVCDATGANCTNNPFGTKEVVVAAITGVPLSLISDSSGNAIDLSDAGKSAATWDKLISADLTKRDPHMVESIAPRAGIPKFAGDRTIDPVNGGDRDISDGDDLQYACIAQRSGDPTQDAADCGGTNPQATNPLCAGPNNQPYFKGYPGLRHLRIIHDITAVTGNGFVASICNNTYSPAIQGIIAKLQNLLNAQCQSTTLTPDANGVVACLVLETLSVTETGSVPNCEALGAGYCTPGTKPCRVDGDPNYPPSDLASVAKQLQQVAITTNNQEEKIPAQVDGTNLVVVDSTGAKRLVCEVRQADTARGVDAGTVTGCQHTPDPFDLASNDANSSWCYSNDPAVVGACVAKGDTGTMRFLGNAKPKLGSDDSITCISGIGTGGTSTGNDGGT